MGRTDHKGKIKVNDVELDARASTAKSVVYFSQDTENPFWHSLYKALKAKALNYSHLAVYHVLAQKASYSVSRKLSAAALDAPTLETLGMAGLTHKVARVALMKGRKLGLFFKDGSNYYFNPRWMSRNISGTDMILADMHKYKEFYSEWKARESEMTSKTMQELLQALEGRHPMFYSPEEKKKAKEVGYGNLKIHKPRKFTARKGDYEKIVREVNKRTG